MSYKKFTFYLVFTLALFAIFNFAIWHLYTKKILTREDNLATGDLTRMGYISGLTHVRENNLDLPIKHFTQPKEAVQNDLLTVGDSFSRGNGWGYNRYYQDYMASKLNWNILYLDQLPRTRNYIESIIALSNSGFLDKYKTKYILIESTQRKITERLSKLEDYEIKIPLMEIEKFYTTTTNSDFALPSVSVINNGNFKFVLYNLLYHFSDRAFFSNVHKATLKKELFSIGSGKELLYYHLDVTSIKSNTQASVEEVNNHLNRLAQFLKQKNIELIFMPAVSKYDLYSDFIVNNKYPKDPFFDILGPLKKEYIFIDTKAILLEELHKGEKDIFYCDDTHWSYKASGAIASALPLILKLTLDGK